MRRKDLNKVPWVSFFFRKRNSLLATRVRCLCGERCKYEWSGQYGLIHIRIYGTHSRIQDGDSFQEARLHDGITPWEGRRLSRFLPCSRPGPEGKLVTWGRKRWRSGSFIKVCPTPRDFSVLSGERRVRPRLQIISKITLIPDSCTPAPTCFPCLPLHMCIPSSNLTEIYHRKPFLLMCSPRHIDPPMTSCRSSYHLLQVYHALIFIHLGLPNPANSLFPSCLVYGEVSGCFSSNFC